jgi:peptidoglycan/LPS O-acetylase OafA/YrhL
VTTPRWQGLDALRAGAMLLGVFFHAAWAYVPDIAPWYMVADVASRPAFAHFTSVVHSFRMEVFFTLAGFFAHLVLERRGANGFLVDRAKRLLVPLVVAAPLSMVADLALRRWVVERGQFTPGGIGVRFEPGYLWFLEALFVFSVIAWGCARAGLTGTLASAALRRALAVPEVLALAGLLTGLGVVWHPELRPDQSFVPDLATLAHHGLFYLFGFLLWPVVDAREVLVRRGWWLLPAGLLLAGWVFAGREQYLERGQVLTGVVPWLVTLGALALAFRVPARERPWLTFLVDASYWVYLVHAPLVVALQVLFSREPWSPWVKYLLVLTGSLTVALVSFGVLVRRSALAPWLGARRVDGA